MILAGGNHKLPGRGEHLPLSGHNGGFLYLQMTWRSHPPDLNFTSELDGFSLDRDVIQAAK